VHQKTISETKKGRKTSKFLTFVTNYCACMDERLKLFLDIKLWSGLSPELFWSFLEYPASLLALYIDNSKTNLPCVGIVLKHNKNC
jgi:hypothetical protein